MCDRLGGEADAGPNAEEADSEGARPADPPAGASRGPAADSQEAAEAAEKEDAGPPVVGRRGWGQPPRPRLLGLRQPTAELLGLEACRSCWSRSRAGRRWPGRKQGDAAAQPAEEARRGGRGANRRIPILRLPVALEQQLTRRRARAFEVHWCSGRMLQRHTQEPLQRVPLQRCGKAMLPQKQKIKIKIFSNLRSVATAHTGPTYQGPPVSIFGRL